MTNDDIRREMATALGWREVTGDGQHMHGLPPGSTIVHELVPDWTSDLNAMHEAEKTLEGSHLYESPWQQYVQHLHSATLGRGEHATARQRAEAFLRVLGKWRDA